MRYFSSALLILAALSTASAEAQQAQLRAGVAEVEITPPEGYRMSGYFYERLNTGTLDPLQAKAVVFEQGGTRAALVFCDLIGLDAQVSQRARDEASRRTEIPSEHIAITATHSHTGPMYFGALRNYFHQKAVAEKGSDPLEEVDYAALLVEKLVEALVQAKAALEPVRLEAGVAEQQPALSFNRRFHMRDGSVRFNPGQRNPDIVRPAGPIDPEVGVLALRKPAGEELLAVCTVFALHLDTVGGTQYSADYPYHLAQRLKQELGDEVMSLFGAGTCGDVNHIDVGIEGRRPSAEIGALLAETVLAALPQLEPVEPSLDVRSKVVLAPRQQYSPEQVSEAARKMSQIGSREVPFLEQVETAKIMSLERYHSEQVPLEVQAFRLGPELAVVTLPGEVFVELGLAIKRASPFKTTLVIELANSTPAYIPTRKAFAEGSYETVNSHVEPGGGELMVEAAVELLKDLHQ